LILFKNKNIIFNQNYIFNMTKKLNQNIDNKNDLEKIDRSKTVDGFAKYLREIQKFPLLTPEQEYEYAVRFIEQNDAEAGKILIQSHLRLVVKIANKFKNYGLPTADLVAEGNMGLIQALKKFEPKKGFRFSTYSMWWIRAFIQDYVLRSWSLVKIGTTSAQKKLFFNLGKIKKRLGVQTNEFGLSQEKIKHIADTLNVSSQEVIDMNSRLTQNDSSLNNKIGEDENGDESLDLIADNRPNQEQISIENQQKSQQRNLFKQAFEKLNLREQEIIFKRQISEDSQTLEELSQHYKVSRERIRQIEEVALKKLKKTISELIK
jgi:RNA polymerase sigma-32 factor